MSDSGHQIQADTTGKPYNYRKYTIADGLEPIEGEVKIGGIPFVPKSYNPFSAISGYLEDTLPAPYSVAETLDGNNDLIGKYSPIFVYTQSNGNKVRNGIVYDQGKAFLVKTDSSKPIPNPLNPQTVKEAGGMYSELSVGLKDTDLQRHIELLLDDKDDGEAASIDAYFAIMRADPHQYFQLTVLHDDASQEVYSLEGESGSRVVTVGDLQNVMQGVDPDCNILEQIKKIIDEDTYGLTRDKVDYGDLMRTWFTYSLNGGNGNEVYDKLFGLQTT